MIFSFGSFICPRRPVRSAALLLAIATSALAPASTAATQANLAGTPEPPATVAEPWVRIEAGAVFSFTAPPATRGGPAQGEDSFVGAYEGPGFWLGFDYGPYSGAFRDDAIDDARFVGPATLEKLTIDGRAAQILTGPAVGAGECDLVSDLFIVGPTKAQNLFVTACLDAQSRADVRRLYESIRFGPGR